MDDGPSGLHQRQGSTTSSVGDADAWSGFAGAAPTEGEERMSVSAALQRFRRMERASKEQRDLAEQQLAVLEAQRQQASLSHRHSIGGGSGNGSPSARVPQPLNMADWLDRASIVKDSIPYPSAQRLAVEAQNPHMPAPVSPSGNVWRRSSLESQGSGEGSGSGRYRRSVSARSSGGGGSSTIVRGARSVSAGPNMPEHADVKAAIDSPMVRAAISAASSPDSPRLLSAAASASPDSMSPGSARGSWGRPSPEGPTRLSMQSSPLSPALSPELTPAPLSMPGGSNFGAFTEAGEAAPAADSPAQAQAPADSPAEAEPPASSSELAAQPQAMEVGAPPSEPPAAEETAAAEPLSAAVAASQSHDSETASAPSAGSDDDFGDFEDAEPGAVAEPPIAQPAVQPVDIADKEPAAASPATIAAAEPAGASADNSDDDFGDFDQADAMPSPPPAEPTSAAATQPKADTPGALLPAPAALQRPQPAAAPAPPPPAPVQLPKSEALAAAQAAASKMGGATGSILDLEGAHFQSAIAAILAEGLGGPPLNGKHESTAALLTLADLDGQQPTAEVASQRVVPIPWRSSQAEAQLLKQLGLQEAAADAAAKQRAAAPGRSLRRRSSSLSAQRVAQEAAAAEAVQRPGLTGSSGSMEHSGSAGDCGSYAAASQPPTGVGAGGSAPFAASNELGFEFVDPPAGFDAGTAASDYVKVPPRPPAPRGPPKPPPVFRSLAADGKAAPKRRLSKFGTPDVEQPAMPKPVLAPPPPSARLQDPLRHLRGQAVRPPSSVDPFAAMGHHDLTLQPELAAPSAQPELSAPQQAAAAGAADDGDDFSTFQSAEDMQAAADAKAAADTTAMAPSPAASAPSQTASAPSDALQAGGSPSAAADVSTAGAEAAAVSQPPAAQHGASSSLGTLQELVPQEADESWLSSEPSAGGAAHEPAVPAATAGDAAAPAEASAPAPPTAEASKEAGASTTPGGTSAPPSVQGTGAAAASAAEDAEDDDFVWSAAEPAAPAAAPAEVAPETPPPQLLQPPGQQSEAAQTRAAAVVPPPHQPAAPASGLPRGFALSLPKPPPGRRTRDVFAEVSGQPAGGSSAPPVDIFAAQQPLFAAAEAAAPKALKGLVADAAPPAAAEASGGTEAFAEGGGSDDDFGDFAAADANGVSGAEHAAERFAPAAVPAPAKAPNGAATDQTAVPVRAPETHGAAEADDEFGDFEAPATEAAEPAAVAAGADESVEDEKAEAAEATKEPELDKDPFADLY